MSCGTGFSCGIHRFDKYKFSQNDKPANKALHDENEKKLQELLKLREQQDYGVFQPINVPLPPSPVISSKQDILRSHQDDGPVLYYSLSDTKLKQD